MKKIIAVLSAVLVLFLSVVAIRSASAPADLTVTSDGGIMVDGVTYYADTYNANKTASAVSYDHNTDGGVTVYYQDGSNQSFWMMED